MTTLNTNGSAAMILAVLPALLLSPYSTLPLFPLITSKTILKGQCKFSLRSPSTPSVRSGKDQRQAMLPCISSERFLSCQNMHLLMQQGRWGGNCGSAFQGDWTGSKSQHQLVPKMKFHKQALSTSFSSHRTRLSGGIRRLEDAERQLSSNRPCWQLDLVF